MATMITADCISCGACEPECPNNAISQGEAIFVIDPKLCTECVGFHDFEACAAVCPVDCCVTDPNNVESEQALISRARALHPDTSFGENFESRFRKGQGKPAAAAAHKPAAAQPAASVPKAAAALSEIAQAAAPAPPSGFVAPDVTYLELPEIETWTIPLRCYKCRQTHVEPVRNFVVGNVIFCPHCNKSTVVRDNVNFHIRSLLQDAYVRWEKDRQEFAHQREMRLAEFMEARSKEAHAFETYQQRRLEEIQHQLEAVGDSYDAPGKPMKRGSRFGWG